MLGATLVCSVGSSRYRARENGQRPFSVVFLNDFRVALRIQITRPQAAEVSKMPNFRHFPSDWQQKPGRCLGFFDSLKQRPADGCLRAVTYHFRGKEKAR